MRHFLSIRDLAPKEFQHLLEQTALIKKKPEKFSNALNQKTLLMFFEQPSVRTHLSFSVGMTQLGGHAIFYDIHQSTLGKKESIPDYAHTVSRYADFIMARLNNHAQLLELAPNSRIPVINAMTELEHPCQALADFFTILEKKGKLKGLKIAYLGDSNNNVTHSLLFGGALLGMAVSIGCPNDSDLKPKREIIQLANNLAANSGARIELFHDAETAVQNADVVYTDSWMSYRIPESEAPKREKWLRPFQVNSELMRSAKKDAIFMHCLPAHRGKEVTDSVIDSNQSVVFDQAENRLHAQKALLLWLQEETKG
jgi:ornithine carbamoyltransferase